MTLVVGGNCVKVISWYDNEWGYSCRVRDLINLDGGQRTVDDVAGRWRLVGRCCRLTDGERRAD